MGKLTVFGISLVTGIVSCFVPSSIYFAHRLVPSSRLSREVLRSRLGKSDHGSVVISFRYHITEIPLKRCGSLSFHLGLKSMRSTSKKIRTPAVTVAICTPRSSHHPFSLRTYSETVLRLSSEAQLLPLLSSSYPVLRQPQRSHARAAPGQGIIVFRSVLEATDVHFQLIGDIRLILVPGWASLAWHLRQTFRLVC